MKTTIFKTIELGGPKPKLKDVSFGYYAKQILGKVVYQKKKETIDLVLVTPKELGFTKYPTTTELFAKAKAEGLELCPAEIGPRLREIYMDQPKGEWIYIAMEPISDSGGSPRVFRVGHGDDGKRWLFFGWTYPAFRWYLDFRLSFRLRKSSDMSTKNLETTDPSDTSDTLPYVLPREEALKLISEMEEIIGKYKKNTTFFPL